MASPATVLDFSFQNKPVRCLGTTAEPWFVAKDVCDVLGITWSGATLANIPDQWRRKLKLNIPHQNQYGQQGVKEIEVVCISEAAVYKLAFRSRSELADVFTNWVAEEVLPSIRKTGTFVAKKREKYSLAGKSEEWVDERLGGVETRKEFTDTLKEHGVEGGGYGQCTNAIYQPVLGQKASEIRVRRGLKKKDLTRDALTTRELLRVRFAEDLAAEKIEKNEAKGNDQCAAACGVAAEQVARTIAVVTGAGA